MQDNNEIVRQRQWGIRRELDRRGIALKVLAFDSGIPYATLLSYLPPEGGSKPVMMPVSALYALASAKAAPLDLLSLLLPDGFVIVRVPAEIDHDEIEGACHDFLRTKAAAHHPESECGREIGPGEQGALNGKAAVLRAVA